MQTRLSDYVYSASLIGLVLIATISLLWVTHDWVQATFGLGAAIVYLLLFAAIYGVVTAMLLAALSVWIPLREGDYAMDHPQFAVWKLQHVVGELGKLALSVFFPVFARAAYYAIFGAGVGKRVAVAGKIIDPRLTVLEDECVLGEGCIVTSHAMTKTRFILGTVRVGRGATVGVGSILMPGVTVGAEAVVLPGSVLKPGTSVPPGETWGGAPAMRIRGAAE